MLLHNVIVIVDKNKKVAPVHPLPYAAPPMCHCRTAAPPAPYARTQPPQSLARDSPLTTSGHSPENTPVQLKVFGYSRRNSMRTLQCREPPLSWRKRKLACKAVGLFAEAPARKLGKFILAETASTEITQQQQNVRRTCTVFWVVVPPPVSTGFFGRSWRRAGQLTVGCQSRTADSGKCCWAYGIGSHEHCCA